MLYHLFVPLEDVVKGFRLFKYVTFRGSFAALLAFLVAIVVGPGIVESLRRRKLAGTALTGNAQVDAERLRKSQSRTHSVMSGVSTKAKKKMATLGFSRLTENAWANTRLGEGTAATSCSGRIRRALRSVLSPRTIR